MCVRGCPWPDLVHQRAGLPRKAGVCCAPGDIGSADGCGENVHDKFEALNCNGKCLTSDKWSRLVSSEVASREVDEVEDTT